MSKREFTIANEYVYHRASAVHWIISHLTRYKHLILCFFLAIILANAMCKFPCQRKDEKQKANHTGKNG